MKNKKSIILTITAVLMMTLIFTACSSTTKVPSDAVAVVNGNNITTAEFNKTLALQRMSYEAQYGPDVFSIDTGTGMTLLDSVKALVLDRLVLDAVLLQQAENSDITVTEEEIEGAYGPYMMFVEENEEFQQFIEENEIDEAFIKEQIRKDTLIHKYKDVYMENLEISEETAKTFYDENPDFFVREEVQAKHILARANMENAETKAQEILSKINSPEDFIAMADEFSATQEEGIIVEDLGRFGRGEMVPEFDQAVFAMEAGEISDIVETTFGYHIILVEDSINERAEFEEIKLYLIEYLKDQDFQNHIEELMEKAEITKREEL